MKVDIYTDGACKGVPGRGSTGYIIIFYNKNNDITYIYGSAQSYQLTTNNRMELTSVISAIKALINNDICPSNNKLEEYKTNYDQFKKVKHININNIEINIFSDSEYVVKGINQYMRKWFDIFGNVIKKDIKNLDLWYLIRDIKKQVKFNITWIKGHNNNEFNELVDLLASSNCKINNNSLVDHEYLIQSKIL